MNNNLMDSNAPPQMLVISKSPRSEGEEKSVTANRNRFLFLPIAIGFGMTGFARGTPVVANRQPYVDLPVIPTRNEEGSVTIMQNYPLRVSNRNDNGNRHIVRDRPLLKFRDGPILKIRGIPKWYARGTPPARSELVEDKAVIPASRGKPEFTVIYRKELGFVFQNKGMTECFMFFIRQNCPVGGKYTLHWTEKHFG
jgi:hypothetical protein